MTISDDEFERRFRKMIARNQKVVDDIPNELRKMVDRPSQFHRLPDHEIDRRRAIIRDGMAGGLSKKQIAGRCGLTPEGLETFLKYHPVEEVGNE